MDKQDLATRRKVIIKSICEKIHCPALVWAFSDPVSESISQDIINEFHNDLIQSLRSFSEGRGIPLPNNTDPYHLPAYVALDKTPGGALALYNLGYRPSWSSPTLHGEKYEVKFFMPNSTPITFLTGPNGGFSVFSLWLEMRIICGEKGESKPYCEKSGSGTTSADDNIVNGLFSNFFTQPNTTRR